MITAIVHVEGQTPYNQSRQHFIPKGEKETPADHEERTWREKGHYRDGIAYIPPMAFQGAIRNAAKRLAIPVPGKGKANYTKHFTAGVMVANEVSLGVPKEEVARQDVSCSPRGIKGEMGVIRSFPHFEKWGGVVECIILDHAITREVFEKVVKEAGLCVGIGQFRPEKGGYYGRFNVSKVEWKETA